MDIARSPAPDPDGGLWARAFGLSVLLNAILILGLPPAFSVLIRPPVIAEDKKAVTQRTITILQEVAASTPAPPVALAPKLPSAPKFSRTSEDQKLAKPESPDFIGERDTQATSSRVPFKDAPLLPSQAGIQPKNPDHIETVENSYQDGALEAAPSPTQTPLQPESAAMPSPQSEKSRAGDSAVALGNEVQQATAAAPTTLLETANPIDSPVPKPTPDAKVAEAAKSSLPKAGEGQTDSEKQAAAPPRSRVDRTTPGFRGNQKKTAMVGSISRTGRSALNVVDSPLGRYQAQISRAVEQEWQRNCIRHRDFITPGFLTVRFFVGSNGRVKTVQFVGTMETGEVQKGFTLNAIRDAAIPEMPIAIKGEYEKEPLEIIFNFYF